MPRVVAVNRSQSMGRSAVSPTANSRINLVANPSFESSGTWGSGVAGSHSNSSITFPSSDMSLFGASSCKVVQGDGSNGHVYPVVANIPVMPGATYTASCYVYMPQSLYAQGGTYITIDDNGFNSIKSGSGSPVSATNQWVRMSVTFTIPGNGTKDGSNKIQIILDTASSPSPLYTAYYDGVLLEKSNSADVYFDGSNIGAVWNGAANSSTSTLARARVPVALRNLV